MQPSPIPTAQPSNDEPGRCEDLYRRFSHQLPFGPSMRDVADVGKDYLRCLLDGEPMPPRDIQTVIHRMRIAEALPDLLTDKQAARLFGVNRSTFRGYVTRGTVPEGFKPLGTSRHSPTRWLKDELLAHIVKRWSLGTRKAGGRDGQ
jgi:hypothetical protein